MNEITLEKIDLVRERTGASYAVAKETLERHNGNVIEAIVGIEQAKNTEQYTVPANKVVEKVKELVKKGNVTRIRILHEGDTLINIPVTAGVVATVLAPIAMIVGAVAAVATKCTIEIERD